MGFSLLSRGNYPQTAHSNHVAGGSRECEQPVYLLLAFVSGSTFSRPGRLGDTGTHGQTVPVLHQDMPHEAELGLFAFSFPEQTGFGIGD